MEVFGPPSSEATMQMLEFTRSNRLPFTGAIRSARTTHLRPSWPPGSMRQAARAPAGRHAAARTDRRPGLPGARNRPRAGAARGGRPSGCRRGARRPMRRGLRRIRGTRHADHRQHGARRAGGRLPADRGLPRIPSRGQRLGADEPCGHARAKVRRPVGDPVPRAFARNWKRTPHPATGGRPRDRRAGSRAGDRRAVPPPAG
jgi:hypothetical protein